MCCVTVVILGAGSAFCTMEEEGFAVPADAGIAKALAGNGGDPVSLVAVQYDDVIYASAAGYYVGKDRKKLDITYPLYTNGGTGLRFLNDEHWMITTEADLYQTFEGLYLREGLSYNADKTQADDAEFILLALSNGLYMNAQQAVFSNALGETVIPMGSILSLSESALSWYAQQNGALSYEKEEAVFDAKIRFGTHEYRYIDLLDALGLLRDAIEHADRGEPDPEKLQEAETILNGKGQQSLKKPANPGAQTREDEEQGGDENNDADHKSDESGKGNDKDHTGDDDGKNDNIGEAKPAPGIGDGTQGTGVPGGMETGGVTPGYGGGGISGGSSAGGGISGGSGTTGGSGGSGGSAGGSGSGSGSGDINEGGGSGTEAGDGTADEVPYHEPKVTLKNLQIWSYALGLETEVDDPSGVIMRGITFSVFKEVKGSGGAQTNAQGYRVYPSDKYEGKSAMLRKNRTAASQEFALSTLPPGQTVYLQYSYRYSAEIKDAEGNIGITRKYYRSELIEIKLPDVTNGNVHAVSADWSVEFGAAADAVQLNQIKLANTSAYKPEAETYSFDNFKLNTLPYVNRLELTLTPKKGGGESKTVIIGSSVLARAQKEGTIGFLSATPKLDSNTEYSCKVVAKDRYGNELPLEAAGCEAQTVYTRKQTPVVTITEKENVIDKLTLGIKVSDPDHALADGKSLKLHVTDSKLGDRAELYGTWDTDKISAGGEGIRELELKDAQDGSTYELQLSSLAFSRLYAAEVLGTYDPQPDDAPKGDGTTLEVFTDAPLGKLTIYTAPLSDGLVAFNSGVADLMDTSVTLQATMTSETTVDILPLIDEFRVILKDEAGNEISKTILKKELLENSAAYQYDSEQAAVVLEAGSALKPEVQLYGTEDKYRKNPWQSFLIDTVEEDPEAGTQAGYTKPMQLKIKMPTGSLTHFTKYSFAIQAVVKKSGQEYFIPISMTNSTFTTKKTIPQVQYKDLFLAADVAEFLNLKIYDPDGTILNDGAVTVQLFYGNVLLKSEQITADKDKNSEGKDLRFEGLIEGGKYTLKFVAAAYNDAEGYGSYQNNYTLKTFEFVGGSAIYGNLNLLELGRSSGATGENLIDLSFAYEGRFNSSGTSFPRNNANYRSFYAPCEPNTDYVITAPSVAPYWHVAWTDAETLPKETTTDSVKTQGYIQGTAGANTTKQMVYHTGENAKFIIVSVGSFSNPPMDTIKRQISVRKYDEKLKNEQKFTARLQVLTNDTVGYLGRKGEKAEVTLTIERSDSMEQPSYTAYKTMTLPLTRNEDGTLSLEHIEELRGLSASDGWRATLTAVYQESEVQLDRITFRTDVDYITVATHKELLDALETNPYANILVTADFVQDQNTYKYVYGTIDFQGHVVTRSEKITTTFLRPQAGSRISNLVYDYPDKAYYVNPYAPFYEVDGTIENLIVRTYGQVENSGKYAEYQKALIAGILKPNGVLRNFIVRAGGDLIGNTEGGSVGVLVTQTQGLVENGYIYGVNGAGFVARGYAGTVGLFNLCYSDAKIRNLYILMDSWYEPNLQAALITPIDVQKKTILDIYSVGDFYMVGAGESKSYLLPLSAIQPVTTNAKASGVKNVWALTSREYQGKNVVTRGKISKLYDIDWQNSVLTGGFDVDECVKMGFYPRLNLPVEMQKYQEYIPLPILGESTTPKIVGDRWADETIYKAPGLDNGYINLRFQNSEKLSINNVEIEGLLTEVLGQRALEGGLYEVILKAQVDPAAPEYVDSYQVTGISYNSGTVRRTIKSDYQTTAIAFWKEVATPSDWSKINDRMDWNYKLTQDLDFGSAGLSYAEININGSKVNYLATKSFTGKIDGQEHVLKGIKLENTPAAHVFYYTENAQIRNLLIEDMTIGAAKVLNYNYVGFVGRSSYCIFENVRIRNSKVSGGGDLGALIGYAQGTTVECCSVTNSRITDVGVESPLYAGALIGNAPSTNIKQCYTRDVDIEITRTNVVNAIGGLAGYVASSSTEDCYTHGTIRASGNYIGGISGQRTTGNATYIRRCCSYVNILQTSGDYAAGIWGTMYDLRNVIALGDVAGTGAHTDRITASTSSSYSYVYAYRGQQVSGLTENMSGAIATELLSGEALGTADVWMDKVRLGTAWDYAPVGRGCMPKLLRDCAREGWTQQEIPLPGQKNDPILSVEDAKYENGIYYVTAKLTHPGVSGDYIQKNLKIEFDGMDISDAAIASGDAKVEKQPDTEKEETLIRITTNGFAKALDSYALKLRYTEEGEGGRERELTSMVQYRETDGNLHLNYWEIPNLDKWNEVMPEHGKTSENILITGMVDFKESGTAFDELEFNRLAGSGAGCGFRGLIYLSGATGKSWITKVGLELTNLSFENMGFDFTQTDSTRNMSAPILSAADVSNLSIQGLKILKNRYTRGYTAFISSISGDAEHITLDDVEITDKDKKEVGATGSYSGAFAAFTAGNMNDIKASRIKQRMARNNYSGGIIGSQKTYGKDMTSCTIENFEVQGWEYVGGVAGMAYATDGDDIKATNGIVSGEYRTGGFFGWTSTTSGVCSKNWHINEVAVTSAKSHAGGIAAYAFHIYSIDTLIENCTVKGPGHVGGFIAQNNTGTKRVRNLQIKNCTIESTLETLAGKDQTSSAVGGVIGCELDTSRQSVQYSGIAVRNCKIEGPGYVGGFMGALQYAVSGFVSEKIYIAEDVTVRAKESVAGGVFGYTDILTLTDSACGATVSAGNNEAGGIIGHLEPQNDSLMGKMERVYYKGKVTAGDNYEGTTEAKYEGDYAGGIIGKLNSGVLKTEDAQMSKILVAADVRSGGENTSLWINDTVKMGDAGTGTIYICDTSLLNGQTAKSLIKMAESTGETSYVLPKRNDDEQLLVSAADFKKESFYQSKLAFGSVKWDYSGLETYMPYTKNYENNAVLASVNKSENDAAAGILVPDGELTADQVVVYTSGINTVNIETAQAESGGTNSGGTNSGNSGTTGGESGGSASGAAEPVKVVINGTEYTADENGVITLYYDFKTDLTIGETTYEAESLCRKVMTYGDYWYYIKDGNVHYGKAVSNSLNVQEDMKEIGTVAGISNAIHLWQGYAMDRNGNCYKLDVDGGTGTVTQIANGNVDSTKNLTQFAGTKAFWQNGERSLYYNFSLYKGAKVPYRVFMLDEKPYAVSPAQNVLYDGVVLSQKTEYGKTSKYFALLDEKSGKLAAYLSNMKLGTITNSEIQQISNNLGYSGTVLLAYYGSGQVVGVDYSSGVEIVSTLTKSSGFALYAKRALKNLFAFGADGELAAGTDFADGENLQNTLQENPDAADGSGKGSGTGNGNGTNTSGGTAAGNGTFSGSGTAAANGEAGSNGILHGGSTSGAGSNGVNAGSNNTGGASDGANAGSDKSGEASNGANAGSNPSNSDAAGSASGSVSDGTASGSSASGDVSNGANAGSNNTGGASNGANAGSGASNEASNSDPSGATAGNAAVLQETAASDGNASGSGIASDDNAFADGTAGSRTASTGSGLSSGTSGSGEASGSYASSSGTSGGANAEHGTYAEKFTQKEALRELFGRSIVAFSEQTGQYELLDTESLANGKQVARVDALAAQNSGDRTEANEDTENRHSENTDFAVAWGLNRSLDTGEKQGFALIALAAAAAMAVLIVLYVKGIRKRGK